MDSQALCMAKSVTNSGHCKALEQLQNDRYKLATAKYFESEHKRFDVESTVLNLDGKSLIERDLAHPACNACYV